MHYPHSPGYKEETTAKQAADSMQDRVPTLRTKVIKALRQHGPMTADETAGVMREAILSIRPRFSELAESGTIKETGQRRINESGRLAKVWRVVD